MIPIVYSYSWLVKSSGGGRALRPNTLHSVRRHAANPHPPKEFKSPNSVKIVKIYKSYKILGGGVRRGVKKHVKIGQNSSIYRKVDLAIAEP